MPARASTGELGRQPWGRLVFPSGASGDEALSVHRKGQRAARDEGRRPVRLDDEGRGHRARRGGRVVQQEKAKAGPAMAVSVSVSDRTPKIKGRRRRRQETQSGEGAESDGKTTSFREQDAAIKRAQDTIFSGRKRRAARRCGRGWRREVAVGGVNWGGNSFQPEVGRLLSRSLCADVFAAERASGRWTAAAAAGLGVVGPGCCPLTLVALVHAFTPSRRSRCSAAQRLLDATLCGTCAWCVHRPSHSTSPFFHGATGTSQAASAQGSIWNWEWGWERRPVGRPNPIVFQLLPVARIPVATDG